jgi:hypothetical protein
VRQGRFLTLLCSEGFLATVPFGLGNAATDAMVAHSGKTVQPAQPPNTLTVPSWLFVTEVTCTYFPFIMNK